MNTPTWGISSSAFLVVFVVLAAISLSLPRLVASVTARNHQRPVPEEPLDGRDLTSEQLAHLAGGPARAVETSVTKLLETGHLRLSRDRRLTAVETGSGDALSDLDAAVLSAVGPGDRLRGVVASARHSRAVGEIGASLVADGLLVDPDLVARRVRLARLAPVLVIVLGLARVGAGLAREASVGFLVVLLVVLAVLALRRVRTHWPTARGDELLSRARSAVSHSGRVGGQHVVAPALAGAAALVAVGGLGAHPDTETSRLLASGNGSGFGGGFSGGDGGGFGFGGGCASGGGCGGGGGGGCGGGGGGGCGGGGGGG